jgi:hypothetical protein
LSSFCSLGFLSLSIFKKPKILLTREQIFTILNVFKWNGYFGFRVEIILRHHCVFKISVLILKIRVVELMILKPKTP